MTVREFLNQAYRLDQRINSKLQQLSVLNDLALKATSTVTGMPHNPNKGASSMSDTICKIIDLQDQINHDIDALVDLKAKIMETISCVEDATARLILEKRYINQQPWPEIAMDLKLTLRRLYYLHGLAIEELEKRLPPA